MQHVDLLSQQDGPHVGQGREEARESRVDVRWRERVDGDVVYLDAVGKVADAASRRIGVGDNDDLHVAGEQEGARGRGTPQLTLWSSLARASARL